MDRSLAPTDSCTADTAGIIARTRSCPGAIHGNPAPTPPRPGHSFPSIDRTWGCTRPIDPGTAAISGCTAETSRALGQTDRRTARMWQRTAAMDRGTARVGRCTGETCANPARSDRRHAL